MILATHGIIQSQFLAGYNPLTTAWIAATGETDTTIINALNTLEQGMIDNSLTSKFFNLYPVVGGSATKHKYNFMDAQDTDGAYRLTFSGGWTHSSTGMLPNGTNAYAATHFNMPVNLGNDDYCFGFYSRTDSDGLYADFGGQLNTEFLTRFGNVLYSDVPNFSGTGRITVANTDSRGHFAVVNDSVIGRDVYRNGSSILSASYTSNTFNAGQELLLSNWDTSNNRFSNRELAMFYVCTALTSSEMSTWHTLVNTFQASLGRNA